MKKQVRIMKWLSVFLVATLICSFVPFFAQNIYDVKAQTSEDVRVTVFATKDELMTKFSPNTEGVASNVGKLAFGKKSSGSDITWYILGKDNSISGDNIALFATTSLASERAFNSSSASRTYAYEANTGYGSTSGSVTVQAGHYGASDLRAFLQQMCADNTYFTNTELNLMQATTITTYDKQNSINYTVTDKLYSLSGTFGETFIYAGGACDIKLAVSSYWNGGALFWLRNSRNIETTYALVGHSGSEVNFRAVTNQESARPATNINLTNVIFASAASGYTTGAGVIANGTAMSIRLNGSNKAIGTVLYDDSKELILVEKDAMATGMVSLVVQGKNDGKDWYYSKIISGIDVITEDNIIDALTEEVDISDINFDKCKIWIETTEDNVSYANMAEENILIDRVEIDINTPIGNKPFNNNASCNTEGVDNVVLNWTDNDGNAVTGNAKYAPWEYVANLVVTPEDGAIILPDVTVIINDESVAVDETNVEENVLYLKTWGILSSVANVTAVDISEITELTVFEEFYDESNVLSAEELPDSVNVTIDNDFTESMNVVWEVVGEYDSTPEAVNTFRWTICLNEGIDYNIMSGISVTGVKEIANKDYMEFEFTAESFEGNYDSGTHGIEIIVNEPGAKVYYSLDGINYQENIQNMIFSNVGTYTIYYKIELEGYSTVTGSKTVKILAKPLEVTVSDQTIKEGENVENDKYIVFGLVEGDEVDSITLKALNDGTITVNTIRIVNSNGADVTANYEITYNNGRLTVEDNEESNEEIEEEIKDDDNIVSPDLGKIVPVIILGVLLISGGGMVALIKRK